jgi:hypothetical protein
VDRIEAGTHVIVLYRRSTKDKQADSLDDQKRQVERFCLDNDLHVDEEFQHTGSAIDIQRDDLIDITRYIDAAQIRPAYVVISALDRLTRSRAFDVSNNLEELIGRGVRLIICNMGPFYFDLAAKDDQDNILRQTEMSWYYIASLATNVSRGLSARSERGDTPPLPLFGFTVDKQYDQRHVITSWTIRPNSEELDAVKHIAKMYVAGERKYHMVSWLNERGFKTSRGKRWTLSALESMITNSLYAGIWKRFQYAAGKIKRVGKGGIAEDYTRFKRREGIHDVDAKANVEANPDMRVFRWDDESVAANVREELLKIKVISEEDHIAIVDRYEQRSRGTNRQYRTWPYSGFLTCGMCGEPMRGFETSLAVRRYQCSGHQLSNVCRGRKAIDEDLLTQRILSAYYLSVSRNTEDVVKKIKETRQSVRRGVDYQRLEQKRNRLEKNLVDQIANGNDRMVGLLEKQILALQSEMDSFDESEVFEPQRYPQDRLSLTSEFIASLSNASEVERLRRTADKAFIYIAEQLTRTPKPSKELIDDILESATLYFRVKPFKRKPKEGSNRKHYEAHYADVAYKIGFSVRLTLCDVSDDDAAMLESTSEHPFVRL